MAAEMTDVEQTRKELHRVAVHVLARRRWQVAGRFGLRVTPGGIATPPFGPEGEQLRTAGGSLVREVGGVAGYTPLAGSTLRDLAEFAGADLDADFHCGDDTPAPGDPDRPLAVGAAPVTELAGWMHFGWVALDSYLSGQPAGTQPVPLQLWPEHFDIGTNLAAAGGQRINLGCSPGDSYESQPYLYVGPWSDARPGDPSLWNAPFGAVLTRADLGRAPDPVAAARTFMSTRVALFA